MVILGWFMVVCGGGGGGGGLRYFNGPQLHKV